MINISDGFQRIDYVDFDDAFEGDHELYELWRRIAFDDCIGWDKEEMIDTFHSDDTDNETEGEDAD